MLRRIAAVGASACIVLGLTAPVMASERTRHVARTDPSTIELITEPDDGFATIDRFFASPRHTLDLVIYELVDPTIEHELAADAARGVRVRVLLDRNGEESLNAPAFAYLSAHGVGVRWAGGFAYTHEKAAVADGSRSMVMTLNLAARYYADTRDFALADSSPSDAAAIEAVFLADWNRTAVAAPHGTDLIWSPGSETALVALIDRAHHRLVVENEEMADRYVLDALVTAARRGVVVDVVMTKDSSWYRAFAQLRAAGATVYADPDSTSRLYIHAKAIVIDPGSAGAVAFIGSENFSLTSLMRNRELGIETTDPSVVSMLDGVLMRDVAAGPSGGVGVRS